LTRDAQLFINIFADSQRIKHRCKSEKEDFFKR